MSTLITGKLTNVPTTKSVKYIYIVSDLFTGLIPNVPQINSVK